MSEHPHPLGLQRRIGSPRPWVRAGRQDHSAWANQNIRWTKALWSACWSNDALTWLAMRMRILYIVALVRIVFKPAIANGVEREAMEASTEEPTMTVSHGNHLESRSFKLPN